MVPESERTGPSTSAPSPRRRSRDRHLRCGSGSARDRASTTVRANGDSQASGGAGGTEDRPARPVPALPVSCNSPSHHVAPTVSKQEFRSGEGRRVTGGCSPGPSNPLRSLGDARARPPGPSRHPPAAASRRPGDRVGAGGGGQRVALRVQLPPARPGFGRADRRGPRSNQRRPPPPMAGYPLRPGLGDRLRHRRRRCRHAAGRFDGSRTGRPQGPGPSGGRRLPGGLAGDARHRPPGAEGDCGRGSPASLGDPGPARIGTARRADLARR